MKKYIPIAILVGVCLLFFYKTVLFGKIPFPGDLLLAGYAPWNHQTYNGYLPGTEPTKNQYFDVIRELYPWKTLAVNQIKQGKIPLWNPYNFSGAPLLANYQSQVLYPLTFLYYLMPQISAWTIMVVIQPILGSIFLYVFATEIGLSSAAAIITAILFNFSSFASVWMEFTTVGNTILWVPLLLYLVERGVKQKKFSLGQQLIFIIGLFCAITGGHPQDFINSFLLVIIFTVTRILTAKDWSGKDKMEFFISPLLFMFGIPFFIAAPQLFPTIELFHNSARVAHNYQGIITQMLVQVWQLPLLAVSDFFGNPATGSSITGDFVGKTLSVGVVGLFLAVTALWQTRKSWHVKFFTLIGIGILLITVRTPLSELLYRYPWPVLSTGTPTRVLFVLMLCLAILAGFGYDAISKSKKMPAFAIATVWLIFIALWTVALTRHTPDAQIMKRAMMMATAILGTMTIIVYATKLKKILVLLLIPLAAAELFYSFLKFNPFVPKSYAYPQNTLFNALTNVSGINRFWGYGTAEIEANFATQVGLYSPDGTDPLNLSWYNRLLQASHNGKVADTFDRTTRSDAQLALGYGPTDLPDNLFRTRLMDVLGVKYVLTRTENPQDNNTFPVAKYKLLSNVDQWVIYENLDAAPRYFVTNDVRAYSDSSNFSKMFFAPDFQPAKTVLVSQDDFSFLPQFSSPPTVLGNFTATLLSYEPNTVKIAVNADTPAFLFLSDTWDNGWTATVNGKMTPVYKTDFAFRGVAIPEGSSTVVFTYQPKSFQTGVAVSSVALLATVLYFLGNYVTGRRKQS